MLNLLTIIVTLLIWGKITKDSKKEDANRNGLMMLLYGALSFFVGFVFYKTYQIGTNCNNIEVHRLLSVVNDKGEYNDSMDVTIYHRLKHNNYIDEIDYEDYNPLGGVCARIRCANKVMETSYDSTRMVDIFNYLLQIKESKLVPDSNLIHKVFERMNENFSINEDFPILLAHRIDNNIPLSTKDSTNIDIALKYILGNYQGLYTMRYSATKMPSLLPWETFKDDTLHLRESDRNYFVLEECIPVKNITHLLHTTFNDSRVDIKRYLKETNELYSTSYNYIVGRSYATYIGIDNWSLGFTQLDSITNYINFLTASDLSQRQFEVFVNSELPLSSLNIDFDVPVEISEMYPSPDSISMNSIYFINKNKLEYIRKNKMKFFAKLPTFENKQLIRSLILTTILTAVVSMFCMYFYQWIKGVLNYLNIRRRLTEEELKKYDKRLKFCKYYKILVICILTCMAVSFAYRMVSGNPIFINAKDMTKFGVLCFTIIVFLILTGIFVDRLFIPRKKN